MPGAQRQSSGIPEQPREPKLTLWVTRVLNLKSTSSTPLRFLPLNRFAPYTRTTRQTLSKKVDAGQVKPSAFILDQPVFALSDLERVMAELQER